MSDTQTWVYYVPEILVRMGEWVDQNRTQMDIACVLHTGDLVNNGNMGWEWDNFEPCREPYADSIPFYPIAGNHDLGLTNKGYEDFLSRRYYKDLPARQLYQNGKAFYALLHAGGTEFLILGASYGCEEESIGFFQKALEAYPEDPAILLYHGYMTKKGVLLSQTELAYQEVVAVYPNVKLVLCGHNAGMKLRTDSFDDDGDGVSERTVYSMMCNFQKYKRYGGQLRILRFDPADRSIEVRTYNPWRDQYYVDDSVKEDPFYLENAF